MDLQRLSDRTEIVELVARYNKASFEIDLDAYGGTFTEDGRYINANNGWVAFGRDEIASAIANTADGGGYQHVGTDHIVEFLDDDNALSRYNMFLYRRESSSGPNEIWSSGFYYNILTRTDEGWRYTEMISLIDRKTDAYIISNLRGLVFSRPPILAALTGLVEMSEEDLLREVRDGKSVSALAPAGVEDEAILDTLAGALADCAAPTNPLPAGTARAVAHLLTHDQVDGLDVETNFREAGWGGPPTSAPRPLSLHAK